MHVPGGLVCALVISAPALILPPQPLHGGAGFKAENVGSGPLLAARTSISALEPAATGGSRGTVVVGRMALAGEASADTEQVIHRAVVRGLVGAGKRAIDPPASAPPGPCTDASCTTALASAGGADYVVGGRISGAQRNYELTLELYDGADGRLVATKSASCPICSMTEVETAAAKAATELADEIITKAEARLSITSCPSGAAVTIDGAMAGNTPFSETVEPGEHTVEIKADGYVAQSRTLTVEAKTEPEAVAFTLVAKGSPSSSLTPLGWAAVGLGGLSVITGIALLAIDNNPYRKYCEGDNIDDAGRCRFQYNTLGGGVTSLVLGAALAGGGAALLILDRKRRGAGPKARAQLRFGVHPRGVTLSGHF